jgi:hypothetical protein
MNREKNEGLSLVSRERLFRVVEAASAKALGWGRAWDAQGSAQFVVSLNKHCEVRGDESERWAGAEVVLGTT